MSAPPTLPTEPNSLHPASGWLKHRVWLGVLGLLTLTLLALLLVWRWPDSTLMHFWLIAQFVPLLYWLLVWALLGAHTRSDDVD